MSVQATFPSVEKHEEKLFEQELDSTVNNNLTPLQQEINRLKTLPEDEIAVLNRELVRKVDIRLQPMLFILLILNYLDRNALAAARVQGLEKDLGLVGNQFNVAISVLFIGYLLGQVPSNLILSKVRPSLYLSACVAIWGIISGLTAIADNYAHLVVIRFFLGTAESPYFPGCLFLLSSWYTKKELALRVSILYSSALLSSAFGGLVSAGIQYGMDGTRGIASWRWLFIIEGACTVFFALLAMVVLPDYPATTRWLSLQEKAIAVYRLEIDGGSVDEDDYTWVQSFKLALFDYKVWIISLFLNVKTCAAAITSFIPTVVATFGYNKVNTLLLTAPPYVLATILSLIISWSSDRKQERCLHLIIPLAAAFVGFIIATTTHSTGPRYFSIFLQLGGLYGSYNVILAWVSSCFPRPKAKRAVAYALVNTIGGVAQVWSPYMFDKKYGPQYTIAFSVDSIMVFLACGLALLLRWCLKRENNKMDVEERQSGGESALSNRIRYVL